MIKQVIVVRKNLCMRKGKIASQVAHASMKVLLDRGKNVDDNLVVNLTSEMKEWIDNSFTKIVLFVNTNEDFYNLMEKLDNQNEVPYALIEDNGQTEFNGVKTKTCVAVGPADSYKIDKFTKEFKLL